MKVRLRSISPFPAARIAAVMSGGMMVLFWPLMLPAAFLTHDTFFTIFTLFAPLLYAAIGWLSGLFSAWLYNIVASKLGALELELDMESSDQVS